MKSLHAIRQEQIDWSSLPIFDLNTTINTRFTNTTTNAFENLNTARRNIRRTFEFTVPIATDAVVDWTVFGNNNITYEIPYQFERVNDEW